MVKTVLAGLALASVTTWTVALSKGTELLRAGRSTRTGLQALHRAGSLDDPPPQPGPVGTLLDAARAERTASAGLDGAGTRERTAWQLDRLVAAAGRRLARGTGALATIGATAPFVGLFGTVWGIMHAFIGIARTGATSLATVAPGIAEALLATAVGLVAAIPAVVVYNLFARAIAARKALLADAAAQTMRLLSRDLDRAARPRLQAAE